jgi:DNA-binding NtrC family response regulator
MVTSKVMTPGDYGPRPPTPRFRQAPPRAIAINCAKRFRDLARSEVVLEKHNRNKPAAAAELGISLKTLYNKLNQLEEERRAAG